MSIYFFYRQLTKNSFIFFISFTIIIYLRKKIIIILVKYENRGDMLLFMIEEIIDNLRDKLHFLILNNEEYSKILKASEELDKVIVQYMRKAGTGFYS